MAESILITGNDVSLAERLGNKFVPVTASNPTQSYTLPCFPKSLTINTINTAWGSTHPNITMGENEEIEYYHGVAMETVKLSYVGDTLTVTFVPTMGVFPFELTDLRISYEGFKTPICTVKNTTMGLMGDAIRRITNKTEILTPSEMVEAIKANTPTNGYLPTKWEDGYPVEVRWHGENVPDFAFRSLFTDGKIHATYGKPFNLKKITFGKELKSIGEYAFYGCVKLEALDLPEGVKTIGNQAFTGCTELTELTFPSTILRIGTNVMGSALDKLTTINFRGEPNSIEYNAFSNCINPVVIKVPWEEGDPKYDSIPWGAANATIEYNCKPQSEES